MPELLYAFLELLGIIVTALVFEGLRKFCDTEIYSESALLELPVVNRAPAAAPQRAPPALNRPPPPPPPPPPPAPGGVQTSTRSQMKEGKKDVAVIDIYIEQEGGDGECPICLSEFKDQELFRRLPTCNHGFHFDCIKIWLDISRTCPLCRRSSVDEP